MYKRKHAKNDRSSPPPSAPSSEKAIRIQRLQLSGLLDQGKTSLFRSLKIARGFERQKLGRRQKTANTDRNAADIERLKNEVAALKGLDLAKTAEIHLYKILSKIQSIVSSPSFPHYVHNAVDASRKQPVDVAVANVQARLFKSAPVQVSLESSLKSIRKLLGIPEVKEGSRKKRIRAKDYQNDGAQVQDESHDARISQKCKGSPSSSVDDKWDDEWGGISDADVPHVVQDVQDLDLSDDDLDVYASRLAGSSASELNSDMGESDTRDGDASRRYLDPQCVTSSSSEEAISHPAVKRKTLPSPSLSPSHSPDPTPIAKKNKKTVTPISATFKPTSTTFLPSLTTTGYISASDSEASDVEGLQQQRKNRRGQKARQALWEKKFGSNARHIAQGKGKKGRDDGWDPKKGATESKIKGNAGGVENGKGSGNGRGRGPASSGANSDPVSASRQRPGFKESSTSAKDKAKALADKPLHPSWEAARKAKEAKAAMPSFQGKKVIFD